jgi:tRNA 2-thiouridine synthesizing protein A
MYRVAHRCFGSTLQCAWCFYDLRGLKCPLPALRARKALSGLKPGDLLIAECTDPLTAIDIPNLTSQTGDTLESSSREVPTQPGPVARPQSTAVPQQ